MERKILKEMLKARGLSQKELANMADIDPINLNRIINGRVNNVRESTIGKLAAALSLQVENVRAIIENKNADPLQYITGDPVPLMKIPLIGSSGSTRDGGYQYAHFDAASLESFFIADPSEELTESEGLLYAFRVRSNEMTPELMENDVVVVSLQNQEDIDSSKVYMLKPEKGEGNSEFCFRRLQISTQGFIWAKSNAQKKDRIPMNEIQDRLFGMVMLVVREY